MDFFGVNFHSDTRFSSVKLQSMKKIILQTYVNLGLKDLDYYEDPLSLDARMMIIQRVGGLSGCKEVVMFLSMNRKPGRFHI